MARSPYEQEWRDDGVATTCVVCGSDIPAGSYPPVCNVEYRNCLNEWKIETEFNRMATNDRPKTKTME